MSLALNDYYMLGSTSGGAPGASWDGLLFRFTGLPGEDVGGVTFTLFGNGTWEAPVPRRPGIEGGNWFTPTTPGIGASYECKFSYSGGTNPNGSVVNTAPDWTVIGALQYFDASLSGDFQSDAWTVLCEVRDATSHVVVASGTFTIIVLLT